MARYEVLKHIPVGEDHFVPGDTIDSVDYEDRDWSLMVRAGDVQPIAEVVGDEPRDENGDTAEMAEMRRGFDVGYAERDAEIERLRSAIAERDQTIGELRATIDTLHSVEGGSDTSGEALLAGSPEARTAEGTGVQMTAVPTFSVKDKGRGWFAVVSDGQEVTKSLRADDVELFPAMTPDEQAAFVEANKPSD